MNAHGPGDLFSGVGWALAGVIAVLLALLVLQIVALRILLSRRKRGQATFRAVWEPVLASCIDEYPARLPALRRSDATAFIVLWNYFQESVLDQAKDRLNRVARRLHVDRAAMARLHSRDAKDRLMALTALGHLGEAACWPKILECLDRADLTESMSAARALVRIDPVRAAQVIAPRIAERPEWPAAKLAAVLAEAGPDALSQPLAAAADRAPAAATATLARLLGLAHPQIAGPVIERILSSSDDPETVGACLSVVQDPALLGIVRAKLHDSQWQIRVQAATALGRFGTEEDLPRLVAALADEQWWVRYRAARAIADLPTVTLDRLRELATTIDDRYGRDMVREIIAERELAC